MGDVAASGLESVFSEAHWAVLFIVGVLFVAFALVGLFWDVPIGIWERILIGCFGVVLMAAAWVGAPETRPTQASQAWPSEVAAATWAPTSTAPTPRASTNSPELPHTPATILPSPPSGFCHVANNADFGYETTDFGVLPNHLLHVDFYRSDGDPERNTILRPGHYTFQDLRGHFWDYQDCTYEHVELAVNNHIEKTSRAGVNTAGWADQDIVDQVFTKSEGDESADPQPPAQQADAAGCGLLQVVDLDQNTFNGTQLSLPAPADSCSLYVVHGDITGTDTCNVRIYDSGESLSGLSAATWKLVKVTGGTREQRLARANQVQASVGSCPLG